LQYLLVDRCMEVARFSGIDTPERKQAFGTQAKQALSSKVFSKTIRVQDNGKDRLVPQRDERPAVRIVDDYAAPEGRLRKPLRQRRAQAACDGCPCRYRSLAGVAAKAALADVLRQRIAAQLRQKNVSELVDLSRQLGN
jgi:hypothetical protein